jgi:transcriptional regulator with XRE-family HTH domain
MSGGPGPDEPQLGLGTAVRHLREEAELTREALAERADLSVAQLVEIEEGRGDPVWGDVRGVAAGLNVSLEQLAELAEKFEGGELL